MTVQTSFCSARYSTSGTVDNVQFNMVAIDSGFHAIRQSEDRICMSKIQIGKDRKVFEASFIQYSQYCRVIRGMLRDRQMVTSRAAEQNPAENLENPLRRKIPKPTGDDCR
ncbi:MAG: hypothetical protein GAK38_02013 [Xylophilus sp.]|nr:MAG: hypothetical protein GAK38_02013 [Xylophilus sp.]